MGNNHRPFFSIIVNCNNDLKHTGTLLQSLNQQGIDSDDLEVVLVDGKVVEDHFTAFSFVETASNGMPCKSNAYIAGLKVCTGQWISFADCSDAFNANTLKIVKDVINKVEEQYLVCTDIQRLSPESGQLETISCISPLSSQLAGKFYSTDNLWNAYNIHFLADQDAYEYLTIDTQIDYTMQRVDRTPLYIQLPTSISRVSEQESERDYFRDHFPQYLQARGHVVLDAIEAGSVDKNTAGIVLGLTALVQAFIHSESCRIGNSDSYVKSVDKPCSIFWHRLKTVLNVTKGAVKVLLQFNYKPILDPLETDQCKAEFIDWIYGLDEIAVEEDEPAESHLQVPQYEKRRGKHRPFFSIVISCYSTGKYKEGTYLDRLLSSIEVQDMPKNDVEVILSDDCSPIRFNDVIEKHKVKLNIKYTRTDHNSGPGDTRAQGLLEVTGQWLCFADHDDAFPAKALKNVQDAIVEKKEEHFAFGDFYNITLDGKVIKQFQGVLSWCHGKFYNVDNFWRKYDIHFVKGLKTHEDIAICTQVNCLIDTELNGYTYLNMPVYLWTANPESLTHENITVDKDGVNREFLEVNFADYIRSTGTLYLEWFKNKKLPMTVAVERCLEVICFCYFYTQGFQFRYPDTFYRYNLDLAGMYIKECKKTFNVTNEQIYTVVASNDAYMYYHIRDLAEDASGRFMPSQTFEDWLNLLAPDE